MKLLIILISAFNITSHAGTGSLTEGIKSDKHLSQSHELQNSEIERYILNEDEEHIILDKNLLEIDGYSLELIKSQTSEH